MPPLRMDNRLSSVVTPLGKATGRSAPGTVGGGTGSLSTILNLTNTIVGAGVLTLPYAVSLTGYIGGSLLLLMAAGLSFLSFILLTECADISGLYSYKELMFKTYGKIGSVFVQGLIVVYTFGTSCSYCVLLGDFFPRGLCQTGIKCESNSSPVPIGEYWPLKREYLIIWLAIAFLLPLSVPRKLDPLKYTSFLAISCVVYVLIMVMSDAAKTTSDDVRALNVSPRFFLAFPLMLVAFTGHYNVLRLYADLQERSAKKMCQIVSVCVVLCLLLYGLMGLFGYMHFGEELIKSNVLNSYTDRDNQYALWARFSMGFVIIFSYPLVHNALRNNFDMLVFKASPTAESPYKRLVPITVAVTAAAATIGILIPQVGIVLGFNGTIGGVLIVYILPGLMYLRLTSAAAKAKDMTAATEYSAFVDDDDFEHEGRAHNYPREMALGRSKWLRPAAAMLVVLGVFFGSVGLAVNVYNLLPTDSNAGWCEKTTESGLVCADWTAANNTLTMTVRCKLPYSWCSFGFAPDSPNPAMYPADVVVMYESPLTASTFDVENRVNREHAPPACFAPSDFVQFVSFHADAKEHVFVWSRPLNVTGDQASEGHIPISLDQTIVWAVGRTGKPATYCANTFDKHTYQGYDFVTVTGA